jgi:signal transduction histidine kinase
VRESLQYVEQRIEYQEIEVELRLDSDLPLLRSDEDKIKSVVVNLLINAVESGGNHIVVETSVDHRHQSTEIKSETSGLKTSAKQQADKVIVLSVEDNGGGIPEEDLPRIFYPFYSTKAGGSGLGLAILSNLVTAHGGKIEAQSQVGRGAKFTVTFWALGLSPSNSFQV